VGERGRERVRGGENINVNLLPSSPTNLFDKRSQDDTKKETKTFNYVKYVM
jgi:hypothetical protein